jgi:putative nucleotidyltransferase-like protein
MPRPRVAIDPEWSLLLAACSAANQNKDDRIQPLLLSPLRWDIVVDLADRHGVQPLLYQALSTSKYAIPTEPLSALKQKYQTNVHKSLMLSREMIRIVDELSAVGIEVMPYKGPALAEAVYGDIALRQTGDIDLFVRTRDISRVREALGGLGFTPHLRWSEAQEKSYLKSGYEYSFDGTTGRNLLEVQWAIQPMFYAVEFDMEGMFRRAVVVPVAGHPMKTPSMEDLFIVLSLHAAKHVWGRLIWLCDLARLMEEQTLDWDRIGSHAKKLGVQRILRVTLLLANRLLGAPIPSNAHVNTPEDKRSEPLVEEIEAYIARNTTFDVESAAYFRLMLRLRERRRDQARFLSRLLFTAGPGEWAAIRLPAPLFPLYRVVRVTRLAAKLVRA